MEDGLGRIDIAGVQAFIQHNSYDLVASRLRNRLFYHGFMVEVDLDLIKIIHA